MVDNKTLTAMLRGFANKNHTNWDEQLQFVMMAYRANEHETTGATPNMCVLGRETTCPLDIYIYIYCMKCPLQYRIFPRMSGFGNYRNVSKWRMQKLGNVFQKI